MKTTVPLELKSEYPFGPHYHAVAGGELHYVDEGSGPEGEAILMLHGNPTWSFFYRNLIKHFSKGHRVVVPDHLGCGLSDKPQDYAYTLEAHIKNALSLIDRLQLKKITLVIHDWGGAIGMGVATRRPELIERVVIMNTAAFTSAEIPWRINILRNPLGEWFIRTFNGFAHPATFMAVTKKLSPAVKRGFIFPYADFKSRIATAKFVRDIPMDAHHPTHATLAAIEAQLKKLKCPVLILWGEKDFCFTMNFKQRWLEFFPEAKVRVFREAGHYLVEDQAPEVIEEIENFIQAKKI